jgi:hypothetical protein
MFLLLGELIQEGDRHLLGPNLYFEPIIIHFIMKTSAGAEELLSTTLHLRLSEVLLPFSKVLQAKC